MQSEILIVKVDYFSG